MLRAVLAVIVGYIAASAVVFVGLTAAWFVLGAEQSYLPGVWDVSTTWIIVSLVVALVAAIVGGALCKVIARTPNAPLALAAIVLVVGGVMAFAEARKERPAAPEPRPAEVSFEDAMTKSAQPTWAAIATPLVAVVGIMIGSGLVQGRRPPQG